MHKDLHLTTSVAAVTLTSAREASVRALLQKRSAENTVRSYRSADAVLQFIVDHVEHQGEAGLQHDLPAEVDAALLALNRSA